MRTFNEPNWLLITAAKVNPCERCSALPDSKPLHQFRHFLTQHPKAGGSSGGVSKEHNSFWAQNGSVPLCSPHFCLGWGHSTPNSLHNLMQQSSKKVCNYWLYWHSPAGETKAAEEPSAPCPSWSKGPSWSWCGSATLAVPSGCCLISSSASLTHISASTADKTEQGREKKDVSGWQHSPINHCFKSRLLWKSITRDNPKEKLREKQKRNKTSTKWKKCGRK